ncbi:MAG TPA: glycosyltransferase [Thermoleophilaceae bacterium]
MARREPEVSVVVPSHERPLRLRWLLNALEEQSLPRDRWELVVVHDCRGESSEELLHTHPLRADGTLRHLRLPAGTGTPGRQRNAGWREAHARLIAFTDDDCRPDRRWLEEMVHAARANEGAIVQGATRPDPFEAEILAAPHARTIEVDPPGPFAQTCNILYPRALLERAGGFAEALQSGEDADLAERCVAAGAGYVGARDAVVFHAVESSTLVGAIRRTARWQDLAYVVKHHSHVRERLELRVFWRRSHMLLALALGASTALRSRSALALALPYLHDGLTRRGRGKRALLRASTELPGRFAIDLTEMATLARGSIRHRTFFL